eukprot:484191_1
MKILFVTDIQAIRQRSKTENDNGIKVYSIAKKCVVQILMYLKQSVSNQDSIHVGIKACDSRAQFRIPREIANSPRKFHEYTQDSLILDLFSAEYNGAFSERQHTDDTIKQTPISRSRSHSRSQLSTPTSSMTHQLQHQSGLAQIVIALLQCMKQYDWSDTLLTNADHDTLEPQMIFILSTIPNDNSIDTLSQWTDTIKILSKKSIAVHFIHIASSFGSCMIPFGANDDTPFKYIQSMDLCLRQWSEGSIGCIPLIMLWLAPILKFEQIFSQLFKSNMSLQLAQHDKFCQQVVRWTGNMTLSSSFKLHCELLSMECSNRWKKYNPRQSVSICKNMYDLLHSNIQSLHVEGVMDQSCVHKMSHLPSVSFIIRPKMEQNTKQETQRFQQLFVSSASNKVSFMVSFKGDENNSNMTGVMSAIIPSFIILKIYVGITWHTPSASIHSNTDPILMNHNQKLKDCVQSMFNRKQFTTNIRNTKPPNASNTTNTAVDMKLKLKRGLKMLYAAQINDKKQQKIKAQQEAKTESKECKTNDVDLSHLELSLDDSKETDTQQYQHLCTQLMNIYDKLLEKSSLKSQHLFAFIDKSYQSFLRLCIEVYNESTGRDQVKQLLREQLLINPKEFSQKRKHLNRQQQLFDIKLQLLLLAEYGLIDFDTAQPVDPLAQFKHFEAFMHRLEMKVTANAFDEFLDQLIERYASQLPNTFAQYYHNKEEDVPSCITRYLDTNTSVVAADVVHPTLPMFDTHTNTHKRRKRKRKRRYTEMVKDDSTNEQSQMNRDAKRFKKNKTKSQRSSKSKLRNVIITPMLATKTNPNQKLVSNTSRRTLTRSKRGGVMRSGKRPLRLVLGDKTNANRETKKRKIDKVPIKKDTLSKAFTVANPTHVFAANTHNHNHAPITGSALKKRSSQWHQQQRLHKSRISQRSKRQRKKNKKTPPLKRAMTQSQPIDSIGNIGTASRTQSLDNLMSLDNICGMTHHNNTKEEEERGQSLPVEQHTTDTQNAPSSMSEDTSPSSPVFPPFSRTKSLGNLYSVGGSFQFKERVSMGDDEDEDVRTAMMNEIHSSMCDNQEWMDRDHEPLPPHMAKNVFIHEAMKPAQFAHFVASSNANSIAPMTPNVIGMKKRRSHVFTPFAFNGECVFGSGSTTNSGTKRQSLIPETPDLNASCDGNGASHIKSHCKMNLRHTLCSEDIDSVRTNLPFT